MLVSGLAIEVVQVGQPHRDQGPDQHVWKCTLSDSRTGMPQRGSPEDRTAAAPDEQHDPDLRQCVPTHPIGRPVTIRSTPP